MIDNKPLYQEWVKSDYEEAGIKWLNPMLAKEITEEDVQDICLSSEGYFVEEKFDGTRGLMHIFDYGCRIFSRRVSEKTGWFCENSDSVPQLRDIVKPELNGTIIDGEMFIPKRPFKDVSSTLNCKWDKAIERQKELGKIVFHAFDILFYRGIDVRKFPLKLRKVFLWQTIKLLASNCVVDVPYYPSGKKLQRVVSGETWDKVMALKDVYTTLKTDIELVDQIGERVYIAEMSPKAYYEFILATGGEGVIVKPVKGIYRDNCRGWEYSKIKKFLTRECIIMGFTDPTKEYNGKFPSPDKWQYWERGTTLYDTSKPEDLKKVSADLTSFHPVSKYYFENWVGNIRFGVIITDEEIEKLSKSKKFHVEMLQLGGKSVKVLEVGECSGFDEEMREQFSFKYKDRNKWLGTVIEVKANEIFGDTGKLRHPRFLRIREDKSPLECKFADHLIQNIIKD